MKSVGISKEAVDSTPHGKECFDNDLEELQLLVEPKGANSHGWELPKHLSHPLGLSLILQQCTALFFKIEHSIFKAREILLLCQESVTP